MSRRTAAKPRLSAAAGGWGGAGDVSIGAAQAGCCLGCNCSARNRQPWARGGLDRERDRDRREGVDAGCGKMRVGVSGGRRAGLGRWRYRSGAGSGGKSREVLSAGPQPAHRLGHGWTVDRITSSANAAGTSASLPHGQHRGGSGGIRSRHRSSVAAARSSRYAGKSTAAPRRPGYGASGITE